MATVFLHGEHLNSPLASIVQNYISTPKNSQVNHGDLYTSRVFMYMSKRCCSASVMNAEKKEFPPFVMVEVV